MIIGHRDKVVPQRAKGSHVLVNRLQLVASEKSMPLVYDVQLGHVWNLLIITTEKTSSVVRINAL